MFVHHEKKLAYLAQPKTASTSMAKYLLSIGFVMVGGHHSTPEDQTNTPDLTDWRVFSVVRNHFDTFVSWSFVYRKAPPTVEFLNFLMTRDKRWFYPEMDRLHWRYLPYCNITLYYETLQVGLGVLLADRGLELPQLNVEGDRTRMVASYYTKDAWDWVVDRFGKEISEQYPNQELDYERAVAIESAAHGAT